MDYRLSSKSSGWTDMAQTTEMRRPQDSFDRIVASLQQAALDPVHWPATAGLIDQAVGMKGNALIMSSGAGNGCGRISFWRVCFGGRRYEDLEREYFSDYWSGDERVARVMRLREGELVSTNDLYTEAEKAASPTYTDLLDRIDMQEGLHVRLSGPERLQIAWALGESNDTRGWSSAQIEAIRKLLPHVRHFASIRQVLADARALSQSLAGLLDNARTGVIQLDGNGRMVEVNDPGSEILRRGDSLLDSNGFLHARTPQETARLRRLLARALPSFGIQGSAGSMTIGHPMSRTRLLVHVSPVAGREWDFQAGRVAALVLVVDPESRTRIDPGLVAAALNLTPAESRLAVMLAAGRSLREIASATGRSEGTVRWHLKQIYRKHGISRQTDLVRRVLALEGLPDIPG